MDGLMNFVETATGWLWGWPILILISIMAVIYSMQLRFFQFTNFGLVLKNTFGRIFKKDIEGEGTISAFEAASSALASTLGTGNIAGVAVAISLGGPGALFWMWVVALIVMILKYAEVTLAVRYREKDPETGVFKGGFMWMVKNGLGEKWNWLAAVFAFLFMLEMIIAPAVQANSVAASVSLSFNVPHWITGLVCAIIAGFVLLGGIKRIGSFASKVVPIMAVIYVVAGLLIILMNITQIPRVFALIITTAFTGMAPVGGFAGSTIMLALKNGFARSIYSGEAGMGTAPFAHAAAITDHPARQGLWGIFEIFVDTLVVCTATGFIILVSGVFETAELGAALTTAAFAKSIPGVGQYIVTLTLILFAFTTMLVNTYYGEVGFGYLFPGKSGVMGYRLVCMASIVVGAIGSLQMVWGLFDTFNGVIVLLNLAVIFSLRKEVVRLTKDFFVKEGVQHSFVREKIETEF
ncbi:MAG: sodium:alanine symporter family protein [Gudongella sp.]|nr:sodium:alanine symporter family protein [Gudongella sp.]